MRTQHMCAHSNLQVLPAERWERAHFSASLNVTQLGKYIQSTQKQPQSLATIIDISSTKYLHPTPTWTRANHHREQGEEKRSPSKGGYRLQTKARSRLKTGHFTNPSKRLNLKNPTNTADKRMLTFKWHLRTPWARWAYRPPFNLTFFYLLCFLFAFTSSKGHYF